MGLIECFLRRPGIVLWGFSIGFLAAPSSFGDGVATSFKIPCSEEPSVAGGLSCQEVRQIVREQVRVGIARQIFNYYLGFETNPSSGETTSHPVPVCNFFTGEGWHGSWAQSVKACDAGDFGVQGKSCPMPPAIQDESSANTNFLRTFSHYERDRKWCGGFCSFEIQRGIASASVKEKGTCSREYAFMRGLWPQVLWKHTESVLNEISQGTIQFSTLGSSGRRPCAPLSSDLNAAWEFVVDADRTFSMRFGDRSQKDSQQTIPHCVNIFSGRNAAASVADLSPEQREQQLSALTDSGFSNAVCMIQAAKVMVLSKVFKVGICEAQVRAQPSMDELLNAENPKYIVGEMMKLVEERTKSKCQVDDDAKLNACYRRELLLLLQEKFLSQSAWQTSSPLPAEQPDEVSFQDALDRFQPTDPALRAKLTQQIQVAKDRVKGR